MTVLLVGADQLGNIPKELKQYGCKEIIHWSGRKAKTRKKSIPANVEIVLVFYDFVSHGLMDVIKEQAKRRQLPIVFSRRGTCELRKALLHFRDKMQMSSDSQVKATI
ncbi:MULTISPECIES: DUF2325 domain-containing protein [Carboxydocella]|uniref:DUF2325 domain-containing protein n=2 Tax=Carboxydocella TaxID=178898 RepID=A0A1T4PUD1_9FIRM|nr:MULTISPECIES: DUF2325 domain-containing protein [Carboxydocella]AVX19661.1 hypothetical protein CFE_0462 [Carboxydocella thermautotrophica]AVX30066.1 hypothetical protein CTH_0463 [Carboxydocella thermautotrophica]SJZ94548.1 hypothetical protein SAMN02745885_01400 [Carboxydocella sporoproducens DSM 16521]GAW29525.1 hypothetical protein ULO1_20950 [Carboxydocella sp. ULO1]GAW31311.1 hypothetical protein JDF658_10760 [Carboxydocella sp. JDF658]